MFRHFGTEPSYLKIFCYTYEGCEVPRICDGDHYMKFILLYTQTMNTFNSNWNHS